jgi:hypothetical protein
MKTPTEITLAIFRALPDPRVERTMEKKADYLLALKGNRPVFY